MTIGVFGAGCFGLVVGWVIYRTLRRRSGAVALSDISTVIGAVGGGAVTAIFRSSDLFGAYAIGLAVGFFAYLVISLLLAGQKRTSEFMGDD